MRKKQNLKYIASYNVQGLNSEVKQKLLADDFIDKKLSIMLLQETKLMNSETLTIVSSNNTSLKLYNSGSKSQSLKGVAILVKENTKIKFEPISERICLAEIAFGEKKINVLSIYMPTEENTEKHPEKTEKVYDEMTTVINKINKRNPLIIGGDFNARTKLYDLNEIEMNKEIVGKYARSKINENGKLLIEFCKIHNLQLTNTFYKHKPSQQVTWISPMKPKNGRKNPYRFQIDYLAVRKTNSIKVIDSRNKKYQ